MIKNLNLIYIYIFIVIILTIFLSFFIIVSAQTLEEYTYEFTKIETVNKVKEYYIKVWNSDSKQVGFGQDGSVEIEKFQIYRPDTLVLDDEGTIVESFTYDKKKMGGSGYREYKYRYDPVQALTNQLNTIMNTKIEKYLDSDIILNKVGQTTFSTRTGADLNGALDSSTDHFFSTDPTTDVGAGIVVGRSGAGGSPFWYSGFRFESVTIPNSATISSAKITLTHQSTRTAGAYTTDIYLEDVDDSVNFSDTADVTSRTTTTEKASAWANPTSQVLDAEFDTADFTSAVQEVVDRGSWASGNDMTVIFKTITGSAGDAMYTYYHNDSTTKAPLLTIEYTAGGGGGGGSSVGLVETLESSEIRFRQLTYSSLILFLFLFSTFAMIRIINR